VFFFDLNLNYVDTLRIHKAVNLIHLIIYLNYDFSTTDLGP
jgi:hypothetical protein